MSNVLVHKLILKNTSAKMVLKHYLTLFMLHFTISIAYVTSLDFLYLRIFLFHRRSGSIKRFNLDMNIMAKEKIV